jgi:hypothetical protein
MNQDNLKFGVIFTADNTELVAATRENVTATTGYVAAVKNAAPATAALGNSAQTAAAGMKGLVGQANVMTFGAQQLIGPLNKLGDYNRRVSITNNALAAEMANTTKQMRAQSAIAGSLAPALVAASGATSEVVKGFGDVSVNGEAAAEVFSKMDGGSGKLKTSIFALGAALGGWGLVAELAVTIGSKLYQMYSDAAGAIEELQPLTNSLAESQNLLGQMFDLTTGKLKNQNEILRLNAQLTAVKLRAEAEVLRKSSQSVLNSAVAGNSDIYNHLRTSNTLTGRILTFYDSVAKRDPRLEKILSGVREGTLAPSAAVKNVAALPDSVFGGLEFSKADILKAILEGTQAALNGKSADLIEKSLSANSLAPELRVSKPVKDRKAERGQSSNSRDRQYGREIDINAAKSIAQRAGFQVNSATRPTYISQEVKGGASSQERLYKAWLAAGRPKDNPVAVPGTSRHETGRALDIQFGKGVSPASIRSAYEKEGVRITKPLKERGHYHIEFSTSGADKTEREAEKIANEFERLKGFGEQAKDRIAQMRGQFDNVPRDVDNANKAIDDMNELMAELQSRKPPGFEKAIADAKELGPLIKDSLRRPILEMLADQQLQIGVNEALLENDQSRASALQVTNQLMQRFGVENEQQLATQLKLRGITGDQLRNYYSQLDVLQEQGRALDVLRQKQEVNLQFLGEFQGGLRDSIQGVLSGDGFGAIGVGLDRIFSGYLDGLATQLADSLLNGIFTDQHDKITGIGKVSEAGEQLAQQVDNAKGSTSALVGEVDKTKTALNGLATALEKADGRISGDKQPEVAKPNVEASDQQAAVEDKPLTVVSNVGVEKVAKSTLVQLLEGLFGEKSAAAAKIAELIPKLANAAIEGQAASGFLSSLGINQSKLGAQIGGVAGKAIGNLLKISGPIGSAVGAIGGALLGTIGGLFKKSKSGSSALSFSDGALVAGGVGGNDRDLQRRSGDLIGGVGNSLASIAEQLGGYLTGRAAVSIGYDKKGRVVVDPTGQNRTKGSGVKNFGKDGEEAARAFATLDALKDGAIAGLSGKVADALRSSTDIEKAIREAVKVDEIEQLLSGFGGASKRAFVDFERQAKDRLRIAGKYGFDLVKLEEENSKQRNKLLNDSIEQATGGLKALLEDLVSGDKAPGTLLDRRAALLAKKAELEKLAPTDADAAAKLAVVLEQLYQVSLDAFGTAGAQFAGDRSDITSSAEAIIAEATAQLTAAQAEARKNAGTDTASTDRLLGESNNTLAQIQRLIDEGNSQSAQMIALLARFNASGNVADAGGLAAVVNSYRVAGNFDFGPNTR